MSNGSILVCPKCKLDHRSWKGNDGHGFAAEGRIYCCRGCFEGTGCECERAQDQALKAALSRHGRDLA